MVGFKKIHVSKRRPCSFWSLCSSLADLCRSVISLRASYLKFNFNESDSSFLDTVMNRSLQITIMTQDKWVKFEQNWKSFFKYLSINLSPGPPWSAEQPEVSMFMVCCGYFNPRYEYIMVMKPSLMSRTAINTWLAIMVLACRMTQHGDAREWKTFSHYWPFVRGSHQSLVDSHHKGSVMQRYFLIYIPEQTVEQTAELLVIWAVMMLLWHHCNGLIVNPWAVFTNIFFSNQTWINYLHPNFSFVCNYESTS